MQYRQCPDCKTYCDCPRTPKATVHERAQRAEDVEGLCLERTNHEPPNVCHRLHGHLGWCADPRTGVTWCPALRTGVQRPEPPKIPAETERANRERARADRLENEVSKLRTALSADPMSLKDLHAMLREENKKLIKENQRMAKRIHDLRRLLAQADGRPFRRSGEAKTSGPSGPAEEDTNMRATGEKPDPGVTGPGRSSDEQPFEAGKDASPGGSECTDTGALADGAVEKSALLAALDVRCPRCLARPGAMCTRPGGAIREAHGEREHSPERQRRESPKASSLHEKAAAEVLGLNLAAVQGSVCLAHVNIDRFKELVDAVDSAFQAGWDAAIERAIKVLDERIARRARPSPRAR